MSRDLIHPCPQAEQHHLMESCPCGYRDNAVQGDGPCMDCGTKNTPVWFTDNHFWNLVVGGPGAREDPGGFLCPWCFTQRAHSAGLDITRWRLLPEFRKRNVGDHPLAAEADA